VPNRETHAATADFSCAAIALSRWVSIAPIRMSTKPLSSMSRSSSSLLT